MNTQENLVDERQIDFGDFASQQEYIKYCRDVEHKHSKGAQLILDLCSTYVQRCEQAHDNGKPAVWASSSWEAPLIYATGTLPIAFTELGRLSSPEAITLAEDYFQLPRETCSMVKAALGEWYLRKNKVTRMLGASANCEPFGQAVETLKGEGFETHFLDILSYGRRILTREDEQEFVSHTVNELKLAAEWISNGKKLDEDRLAFEIKRTNQTINKVRKILSLRIKKPLFLRSLVTMYTIIGSSHFFGDPESYNRALDLIIKELEAAPEEPFRGKDLIPIMWIGARGQEFGIFKTLDDLNAAILGWNIPTPFLYNYDETLPPLEALARYQTDMINKGNNIFLRIDDSIQWLKGQGVTPRGAILYGYFGCSINTGELTRTYLAKKGLPGFIIEGTFQVGPPSGQLITRIKAFLEVLT